LTPESRIRAIPEKKWEEVSDAGMVTTNSESEKSLYNAPRRFFSGRVQGDPPRDLDDQPNQEKTLNE
jgi:hypothetical protein